MEEAKNSGQTVSKNGSRPSAKGPEGYFTGTMRIDLLFEANKDIPVAGAYVTFEPGARTDWHSHPVGQRLIVTFGSGLAQIWGGPVEEIKPGDVVWFPPGVKHWHGASPTTAMTHIALTGESNGSLASWMEKVSGEQYGGK